MNKKNSKKYVQIYPMCGSKHILTDFSNPGLVVTGLFNNYKKCNKCGFTDIFSEVTRYEIKKNKGKLKKLKKKTKFENEIKAQ